MHFKFALIISILFLCSCKKEHVCNFSKGEVETLSFSLDAFVKLEISGRMEVEIVQSDTHRIEITAGSKLIPNILFEVTGDTLKLKDEVKCGFLRDRSDPEMKCKVFVDTLIEIRAYGFGRIFSSSPLVLNNLKIQTWDSSSDFEFEFIGNQLTLLNHTGPSNFLISGSTNTLELYSGGNGILDCSNLESKVALINHQGTGDFLMKASHQAFVEVGWTGNVLLFSNPDVLELNDYGRGSLIFK